MLESPRNIVMKTARTSKWVAYWQIGWSCCVFISRCLLGDNAVLGRSQTQETSSSQAVIYVIVESYLRKACLFFFISPFVCYLICLTVTHTEQLFFFFRKICAKSPQLPLLCIMLFQSSCIRYLCTVMQNKMKKKNRCSHNQHEINFFHRLYIRIASEAVRCQNSYE